MKKGFKNYFKSWLVYILIVLLINFILGMFMTLIGLQIQDLWLSIISLGIALGTLYGVSDFMDVSFWKLTGFTILVGFVLSLIMSIVVLILVF